MSSLSRLNDSSRTLGSQSTPTPSSLSINNIRTIVTETGGSMTYPGAGIAVSNGALWLPSIVDNSAHWNTAYGWGDHSTIGYLTSETDPVFTASDAAGITSSDITNWNIAYGWGDHSGLYQALDGDLTAIAALSGTSGLLRKTAANTWTLDTSAYTFQHSLSEAATIVSLVNDVASPGNSKLYGTNSSGVRGWYDIPTAGVPGAHATTHQNGGADEISVTGLSGLLADAQTPLSHAVNASTYGYGDGTVAGHLRVGTGLTVSTGTVSVVYGTGINTACVGNDSRLSNSRTPTAHSLTSATYHTVSGLTTGHFLKATGSTTFGFTEHGLTFSDVGAQEENPILTGLISGMPAHPLISSFVMYTAANTFSTISGANLVDIAALTGTDGVLKKTADVWGLDTTLYQSAHANLSSLSSLTYASSSFVKMTGIHTFTLDTSTYATTSHTHSYEPALGNPAADGRVLSSTAAGVRSWIPIATTDHGALTGLADDDHTQYYNQTRGDARYSLTSHTHLNYATLNVTTNSKTSAYTVVTGDNNKIIECSGTFTVTLPDSLATGFQVTIVNVGTGTITIAASTTLYSKDSNTKLASRWIGATAYHRGSNVWVLMGDLTA